MGKGVQMLIDDFRGDTIKGHFPVNICRVTPNE
jgi:hypothetical protein